MIIKFRFYDALHHYFELVANVLRNLMAYTTRVSDKFCPWLTNDFKVMCKARDKSKRQAIHTKSELLMQFFRHLHNQVKLTHKPVE